MLCLSLTACGSAPLAFVANHFDRNDPCQTREFSDDGSRLKPSGYQPSNCGGTRTTIAVIRSNQGQQIGVITNR
jgi:hypothetical protein